MNRQQQLYPLHNTSPQSNFLSDSDKYLDLINHMQQGFCIIEVLFDDTEQPLDYRFLEVNPVFEQQTGLINAVGKTRRELQPVHQQHWFDQYAQVAKTGQSVHLELQTTPLGGGGWFDVFAFPFGPSQKHQVAILFNDITERKQREHQRAFLFQFSDAIRPLTDPVQIMATVSETVGRYYDVGRCGYAEVPPPYDQLVVEQDWTNGLMPSLQGSWPLVMFGDAFSSQYRTGQTVVVEDALADDRRQGPEAGSEEAVEYFRSSISVQLIKQGHWVASFYIQDTVKRSWTPSEVALMEDITERTWAAVERAKAEQALQASERFVQGVIRSLPFVIYLFDLIERRNRYLSPQVAQLFGYTAEEMQTQERNLIETFFHPDDRPRLAAHFEYIRTNRPNGEARPDVFTITYRITHRQRGWRWVESRDTVYARDAQGVPTLVLGTAEDITERLSIAQAVVESEKRLRLAIEATKLATWEWNLETNEVYWNEQHFHLFGMKPRPHPLSLNEFMRYVHPHEQQRVKNLLERSIAERVVCEAEFCAVREDGSHRWMSGYGRITEERDGQPIRLSGVMFDVDERRRAEDALRLADQRKDEFLAMLAHELRNPMSTIRSGLQILTLTDRHDETSSATIDMMNRQTDHLVRMIDDLLDISRISRGKIELKKERVDLAEVVNAVVQSVRPLYQELNRHLQLQLPTAPLYLEGDATRLTQIVTNLLTNGARYTEPGGQVWLSLEPRDGLTGRPEAILQVRDNGIGLAANQLAAIFELFVQVDNSTARSKGGLGLGLTLVKRLVELHGGGVEVQSEGLGKGSSFTVHLPTLPATTDQAPKSNPPATDSAAAGRILVVDDNADAALTLSLLLKLKGYEVHTQTSGRTGIEAAESLRPAAILLDIGMPELDGYETCRLIRQQPWGDDVMVIALTGYGQKEDRQRTQAAGFNGHLVKPVDLTVLTNLLIRGAKQPKLD